MNNPKRENPLDTLVERHELQREARAEKPVAYQPLSEAAKAARREKIEKIIAKLLAELRDKK